MLQGQMANQMSSQMGAQMSGPMMTAQGMYPAYMQQPLAQAPTMQVPQYSMMQPTPAPVMYQPPAMTPQLQQQQQQVQMQMVRAASVIARALDLCDTATARCEASDVRLQRATRDRRNVARCFVFCECARARMCVCVLVDHYRTSRMVR
jgi:hypothetical protein